MLFKFAFRLFLMTISWSSLGGSYRPASILFIENKGQWNPEVRYVAEISQGKVLVMDDRLVYVLHDQKKHYHHTSSHPSEPEPEVLTVKIEGMNKTATLSGKEASETKYNYYYGKKKGEHCRGYALLQFKNIYEGVDLLLYSYSGHLKYDLLVSQQADLCDVRFNYQGGNAVYLEDGCSFVDMDRITLMEDRPLAYQIEADGTQKFVRCNYSLREGSLGFELDHDFNPDLELVIDPELIFSTFSGSASDNFGYTACFDEEGSLYSGGIVFGGDFPATTGATFGGGSTDIAILKYDSSGAQLDYATFIGGSSEESPHSLVVNNAGELIIMGTTGSLDFPTSATAFDQDFNGGTAFRIFDFYDQGSDIIVSKLDPNGLLLASTFIGGLGNDGILKMNTIGSYTNDLIYNYGDFHRGDVIVDADDNVYVASSTESTGFPISGAAQDTYGGGDSDAVVFSLSADLSQLRWSTYFGGLGEDAAYSIKLDSANEVFIGGGTNSENFRTTAGALNDSISGGIDGFITRMDPQVDTILISASTLLGTSTYDQVYFIDLDTDQNVYAMGQTAGPYPVVGNVYSNPNSSQFIHKISPELDSTIFSTVFGSGSRNPNISPTAFLANECENIFVSGWGGAVNNRNGNFPNSTSTTFGMPVTSDALFTTTDGSDFYLMVLSADGSELLYATFYGSTNNSGDHVDGGTSRFDKRGIVYQSVCSCGGLDDDFPTTPGAWSRINRGTVPGVENRCNNAAFKFDLASLDARFQVNDSELLTEVTSICLPSEVIFENQSIGGQTFNWDFGDGTTSSISEDVRHQYQEPGTYLITLTIRDENTCKTIDQTSRSLTVFGDEIAVSDDVMICRGASTQLSGSGGISYRWSPSEGLSDLTSASPLASPVETTTYYLEAVTPNGCLREDSVEVSVEETIEETFEVSIESACSEQVTYKIINRTVYAGDITWDFGNGRFAKEREPTFTYENEGDYVVNLVLDGVACFVDQSAAVTHVDVFVPNVFTPNSDGVNEFFDVISAFEVGLSIFDRTGKKVYSNSNYHSDWSGGDLPSAVYYYQVTFPDGPPCNGWFQLLR